MPQSSALNTGVAGYAALRAKIKYSPNCLLNIHAITVIPKSWSQSGSTQGQSHMRQRQGPHLRHLWARVVGHDGSEDCSAVLCGSLFVPI